MDDELDSGKINKRQYAGLVSYKASQLKQYFDKKDKAGKGKGIPTPLWDVKDPMVLGTSFNDDVKRGLDVDDIVDDCLETI